MGLDNLQTDSSKWTKGDAQRSRLERELKRKGFKGVVVGVADPFEIDGPFFLRFADGYTAPGEYKELNRCIAQASESDTDSLKALLRNAEENAEVAAYFIWKEEGCPDGRDLVHWDMAIENLKRARAGVPVSS